MGARARRMLQPAVRANPEQPETTGPRGGQQPSNDRPDRWVRARVLQSAERFEWRGRLRQRHTRSSVVVASVDKSSVFERVSDSVAGCAILTLAAIMIDGKAFPDEAGLTQRALHRWLDQARAVGIAPVRGGIG